MAVVFHSMSYSMNALYQYLGRFNMSAADEVENKTVRDLKHDQKFVFFLKLFFFSLSDVKARELKALCPLCLTGRNLHAVIR